jgi:DNA-directed RNA polymerase subunit RPC12/RpoP
MTEPERRSVTGQTEPQDTHVYYCQTCGKTRFVQWLHRDCPPDIRPHDATEPADDANVIEEVPSWMGIDLTARATEPAGPLMIHEKHICRDCGAEITLPYAKPGPWVKHDESCALVREGIHAKGCTCAAGAPREDERLRGGIVWQATGPDDAIHEVREVAATVDGPILTLRIGPESRPIVIVKGPVSR